MKVNDRTDEYSPRRITVRWSTFASTGAVSTLAGGGPVRAAISAGDLTQVEAIKPMVDNTAVVQATPSISRWRRTMGERGSLEAVRLVAGSVGESTAMDTVSRFIRSATVFPHQ
ncbi:hypothetical protein GCM10009546_57320 [Actinomadura livida]|uniref:Uncharacterized protein n=1 Tax=Actinomadura livida TaxID=79909 RepID=A0ABP3QBH1_9ACTN|nr:hypothetical protein GCM10010208_63550 [Actinomadura livida]